MLCYSDTRNYSDTRRRSKIEKSLRFNEQIRIKTPKIGDHDLQIKVGHAREFLQRGDRVQFTLRFRGREVEASAVAVRHRTDGDLGGMPLDDFVSALRTEIESKGKTIKLTAKKAADSV